jgi:hypothetical protein
MEQAAYKCVKGIYFRIFGEIMFQGGMEMRFLNEGKVRLRIVLMTQWFFMF